MWTGRSTRTMRESLLEVIREKLGVRSASRACNDGTCGACRVLLDGALVASCRTTWGEVAEGARLETYETLSADPDAARVVEAFAAERPTRCRMCVGALGVTACLNRAQRASQRRGDRQGARASHLHVHGPRLMASRPVLPSPLVGEGPGVRARGARGGKGAGITASKEPTRPRAHTFRPPAVSCERTNRSTPHVSRVLSRARVTPGAAAIIPLGRRSPAASSSLPAGSGESALTPTPAFAARAPAYVALLPMGFAVPPALPRARWALTPPFHPYRRRRLRASDGGLFSVALSSAFPPPGVTRHRALWSSDFPPVALRSRRSGGEPAIACVMSAGRCVPPSRDARKRRASPHDDAAHAAHATPGEMVHDGGLA